MTGDPARDHAHTERHFADGEDNDYAAAKQHVAEVERQHAIDNGRAIVRYDWLWTLHGERLHYAELTDEQAADMDDYRQLGLADEGTDGAFRLACGWTASYIGIPGVFSRMGLYRCARCCDAVGMPRGKGSPKNDPACREALGMDKEET